MQKVIFLHNRAFWQLSLASGILSCNALAIVTLQLSVYFTRVAFWRVASHEIQSRDSFECTQLKFSFHSFTHNPYIIPRNGNGLGSSRVFPYPDPTHGLRPTAQTRLIYQTDFYFRAPLGRGTSGPILWPNKKKCLPNIDFLSNQTRDFLSNQIGGEKEHSRKPIIFSTSNRFEQSETNKTHYFLSNQQIGNPSFFITIFSHIKSKNKN